MGDIYIWLWAILGHWQVLMTGGIVVAILTVYQSWKNKTFSWRFTKWIALSFLVASTYMVWHDTYLSMKGRERDLHAFELRTLTETNQLQQQVSKTNICEGRLFSNQQEFIALLSKNQGFMSQQSVQMHGQQSKLDACLIDLGKAHQPEPRRIAFLMQSLDSAREVKGKHSRQILVLTNKIMERTNLQFVCDKPFITANAGIFGAAFMAGGTSKVAPNAAIINITAPAWSPSAPVVITMDYDDEKLDVCGVNLQ